MMETNKDWTFWMKDFLSGNPSHHFPLGKMIDELDWKIMMLRVRFWSWKKMMKEDIFKNLFCRFNLHDYGKGRIGQTSHNKGRKYTRKTTYFQCMNCHLITFPTKLDRKHYVNIKSRNSRFMRKALAMTEKKGDGK